MVAPVLQTLADTLACPRCETALSTSKSATLRCGACRIDYPLIGSVPWLFAEPDAALAEWRQRFDHAIKREQQTVHAIDADLARTDLHELTVRRLGEEREGHAFQAAALSALLQPLAGMPRTARPATYLALRTRLPADQGLNTYFPNIHRDWSWGGDENRAALKLVTDAVGDAASGQALKILIPGAGAGRLACDLHRELAPELSVALDFNPLLLLIAERLMSGESIELYEFPIAPKTLQDHAIRRTLKAGSQARDGLGFVAGDVLRAPFRPGVFDVIVTPWLIDIIAVEPTQFIPRMNHLLRPDGLWVNFGSLAFRHSRPAARYSLEETLALIMDCGFSEPLVKEAEIPYMRSPSSRHARLETVVTMAMRKIRSIPPVGKYRALPDWIVIGKTPVPATDAFRMQAAATRIHAFIMSLVDGRRSLEDMAALMEQQQLMPKHEARDAIRGFLIKMHDDSHRYSGY